MSSRPHRCAPTPCEESAAAGFPSFDASTVQPAGARGTSRASPCCRDPRRPRRSAGGARQRLRCRLLRRAPLRRRGRSALPGRAGVHRAGRRPGLAAGVATFGEIAVPIMWDRPSWTVVLYAVLSLTLVRRIPVAVALPVAVIAVTVFLSVLAHGFSATPLAARYGRAADARSPNPAGRFPICPCVAAPPRHPARVRTEERAAEPGPRSPQPEGTATVRDGSFTGLRRSAASPRARHRHADRPQREGAHGTWPRRRPPPLRFPRRTAPRRDGRRAA
ncbi:hypothetical protein SAMN06893097_110144 [Geodermatophilus sabuli]|uniref:Uncharacterized protein n=1 Tax=Geodermatophilus sabuli TaxID=1564158 RepID=A0A285EK28_9ACTN|nr:hypothetical protein SAMN06893097_110144 [Geodermatophilus sabuli]